VPTRPEMAQDAGGTAPAEFLTDRGRLIDAMKRFAAARSFAGVPHPIFGPMTTAQWQRWGWLHADHHFRQFSA
jgi:hypothetical protein